MGNTLSNIPDPYDPYGFSEKEEKKKMMKQPSHLISILFHFLFQGNFSE